VIFLFLFYDQNNGVFLSHNEEDQSGEFSLQLRVQGWVIELGGHEKKVVL
jgi:hypothetical protein